jgi:dTDP-glucose 4,6-dehydratase
MKNVLITGGAGFIGSHVVRLFVKKYPDYKIFNLDKLTYAGNLRNIEDMENEPNYYFLRGDIADRKQIEKLFGEYSFDSVIHLAAESHVDRSISNPLEFLNTNIVGTVNLLDACRSSWKSDEEGHFFLHISTDEVYGSLGEEGFFVETTPYDPQSPYSASKAGSDHFVRAYGNTFGLPYVITNCSNNYGPNQFPEKLIPLFINNIRNKKSLPVYGKGENVRDWLFVEDHARAIDMVFHNSDPGKTYNIGGFNEWKNLDLIYLLCDLIDKKLGNAEGSSRNLVSFVKDRAGHDHRYAIDSSLITKEIGWKPSLQFEEGLSKTVDWYIQNSDWLSEVTSGEYLNYYRDHYESR